MKLLFALLIVVALVGCEANLPTAEPSPASDNTNTVDINITINGGEDCDDETAGTDDDGCPSEPDDDEEVEEEG